MFWMILTAFLTEQKTQKEEAYDLLKAEKIGVLSTLYDGTPFGSLVPYALDDENNPIIYISDLAVHTDNLKESPKCSLTVSKIDKNNIFNSARITIVAEAVKITGKDLEAIEKIYFAKYPESKKYKDLHDFNFYKLKMKKAYYVGGFGNIGWVD